MKWSWKIGQFAGIGVYVHATFLLIIGWVVLMHWKQGHSVETTISGVIFVLAIFFCIVLHEFGHALTAKRYGIKTRDITLLPIGGVARLERMPDDPRQELWVAVAGPAVNIAIAILLYLLLIFTNGLHPMDTLSVTSGSFLERLMVVNVFLVIFNMIPAFPMDGGRVLRSFLAMRMDYIKATQTAATVGQGIALIFGFIGLFSNPFLIFIALFVWIGAAQESSMAKMRSALGGIPVASVMLKNFSYVSPNDKLADLITLTMSGNQQDFPVMDSGGLIGIVNHNDLINGLSKLGRDAPVSQVMRTDYEVIDSSEMLEFAFARLKKKDFHTLPVLHNGRLIGLLTMDNVGEFIRMQSALVETRTKTR